MPNRTDQLKSILGLLQSSVTKAEMADAMKTLLTFVKEIKTTNTSEFSMMRSRISMFEQEVKDNVDTKLTQKQKELMDACVKEMNLMMQEHDAKMQEVDAKLESIVDGKDADEEKIVADVLAKIPPPQELKLDDAVGVRNKLETLKGDERLDKSAVRGIDDIEKKVQEIGSRPAGRGGGAKGFTLYINGVKKLLTAQTINITGSGVAYNYANGRNDITITGGAGSLSVLPATGSIDDANTAFTFASEPTIVMVNGAAYRHGHGVTIAGTNVTLDNPAGTGGDIYGLGS